MVRGIMVRGIVGIVVGVLAGGFVAFLFFGAHPPLNGEEKMTATVWMAVGAIAGAFVKGGSGVCGLQADVCMPMASGIVCFCRGRAAFFGCIQCRTYWQ